MWTGVALGCATGAPEELFVTDYSGTSYAHVKVINWQNMKLLRTIGSYGATGVDGTLNQPTSIALDCASGAGSSASIYVSDYANNMVQVFNATSGVFRRKWTVLAPNAIVLFGSVSPSLYVLSASKAIFAFAASNGTLQQSIATAATDPAGLAIHLLHQRIYVSERAPNQRYFIIFDLHHCFALQFRENSYSSS